MAREGNNPKRRMLARGSIAHELLETLAEQVVYVGSANHKRRPGDYGFHPPANPRPWKSLCDAERAVLREEAQALLQDGVRKGMVSATSGHTAPKYIWSVDGEGVPYEAKVGNGGYHGYRLEPDDAMSGVVLDQWARR